MRTTAQRRFQIIASLVVCASAASAGGTIDRIAVSVGRTVITESQILQEARVAGFIEGAAADLSTLGRSKTITRLIDQTLLRREMEFTRFTEAPRDEGEKLLPQLTGRYATAEAYRAAIAAARITEDELIAHLTWQVTLLRFIQYRFQPGIQVNENDLREFYDEQSEKWREEGKPVPNFDDARPVLEPALISRYVDQALDRWLGEQRTQTQIVYKKPPAATAPQ